MAKEIYCTLTHVNKFNPHPQYEIRDNEIYRTLMHVDGFNPLPQYEIRDLL